MSSKKYNQYKGKAGHLFVMSELLWRGWNVGIPEVDVGDDVFVVHDKEGDLRRVQVKTTDARIYKNKKGFSATFTIPRDQLKKPKKNEPVFTLVVRKKDAFTDVILIERKELEGIYDKQIKKATKSENISMTFCFYKKNCSYKKDMTVKKFLNKWETYFKFIIQ